MTTSAASTAKTTSVRINVEPAILRRFKAACALAGVAMAEELAQALLAQLAEMERKK